MDTRTAPATRRGSSGAVFTMTEDGVWKTGNERVVSQGWWLCNHHGQSLPTVTDMSENGYQMEMLTSVPLHLLNPFQLLQEMMTNLKRDVWSKDAEIPLDMDAHVAKMDGLIRNKTIGVHMTRVREDIWWSRLKKNLTHGDTTFDNVMFRDDGQLVMIDPIPATSSVPDYLAVDYGKIIQSLVGFERIRYGRTITLSKMAALSYFKDIVNDTNTWRASVYWGAVHLLRAVPYMPTKNMGDKLENEAYTLLRSV